jgi:outer membrane receptor for ferrienterochelin and colicins
MKRVLMLSAAPVCLSLIVAQSPAVAGQAAATDTTPEQVIITGRLNETRDGLLFWQLPALIGGNAAFAQPSPVKEDLGGNLDVPVDAVGSPWGRVSKQIPGSFEVAADNVVVSTAAAAAAPGAAAAEQVPEQVLITAHLNEVRAGIEPQIGASTYTIDAGAIDATPAGSNTLLNQVVLQAPSVAQDSFGQIHIRGDHNGLQYRLNGLILPEGISVFSQTFSAHLVSAMKLITGTLPAEYGLRTAGIVDLTTKGGLLMPGGDVSIYGGSHGVIQPSFDYGGSSGNFSYFVSGDFLQSNVGIESPDGRPDPIHDKTQQYHGFGYFEDILDQQDRVTLVLGTSNGQFQIPNQSGLQPADIYGGGAGIGPGGTLVVNGQDMFASEKLNETQREVSHFGVASFQHAEDAYDVQSSLIARYSSLNFVPDPLGDLLFNGLSQTAFKQNVSYGFQTDAAFHVIADHTVRAGFYIQTDRGVSKTTSQVLLTDPETGIQTSQVPTTIVDNSIKQQWIESVYLQDEWKLLPMVTVNYGLRFDNFTAFDSENQLSPRVNVVWTPFDGTTLHAGYSRYFSPPPFELVGDETISKFANTTNAPTTTLNSPVKAERSNYFDVGAQQMLFGHLTLGVDTFYKIARNLIDEGQFGAPIILTPFNYRYGKVYGEEFTANYTDDPFSAYVNLALLHAQGKDFVSSQFNFSQDDIDYVSTHYIDLDHEQHFTISAGGSYTWEGTRFMADMLFGSGLRASLPGGPPNGTHLPYYTQVNLGVSHDFEIPAAGDITARFDVINVFDEVYQIRNGTGVGVGAPQFGPRRGFYAGISKSL